MADAVLNVTATTTLRPRQRNLSRFSALWRLWRIRRTRRALLRRVLAEVTDPRFIEDVGLTPPARNELDLFVRSLLPQRL